MNPSHYTPIVPMKAKQVAKVQVDLSSRNLLGRYPPVRPFLIQLLQDDYGAGVWFNTMVSL